MIVLSLDISVARTGYAYNSDTPGVPFCGHYVCEASIVVEGGRAYGPMYSGFRKFLWGMIRDIQPHRIVFETPLHVRAAQDSARFRNMDSFRPLNVLAGIVEMSAWDMGIDCTERGAGEIKKFFTGNGHAVKSEMLARCKQLRWPATNHDEADACALWALEQASADPKFSLSSTLLFARGTQP